MVWLRLFLSILLCCSLIGISHAGGKEKFVAFKYSHIIWDDSQFTLGGNTLEFDKGDSGGVAVELSLPVGKLISLGFEYLFQSWDLVTDPVKNTNWLGGDEPPGYANITIISFMARYRFTETDRIRPTLGVGYGSARFSVHSGTNVVLEGYSYQLNAAVDFMLTPRNALALSVTRLGIDVSDSYQNKVKNNAIIYQLSYNLHF